MIAKRKPGSRLTFSQIDGEAGGLSGSEDGKEEEEGEEEKEEEIEEKKEVEEKVEVEEREEKMVQPWISRTNQGDYTIDDPTITSSSLGKDTGLGGQNLSSHQSGGSQSDEEVNSTELHPRPLERARARRREREVGNQIAVDGVGEGLVSHSGPDLGRARDHQRAQLEAERARLPEDRREGPGDASRVSSAPNQKYPAYLDEELEEILEARRLCVCGLCTYPPVFCRDM